MSPAPLGPSTHSQSYWILLMLGSTSPSHLAYRCPEEKGGPRTPIPDFLSQQYNVAPGYPRRSLGTTASIPDPAFSFQSAPQGNASCGILSPVFGLPPPSWLAGGAWVPQADRQTIVQSFPNSLLELTTCD